MAWHGTGRDEIWFHADKYNYEKTKLLLKLCKDKCKAELGQFEDLLKKGADPNSRDWDGWTPLTRASDYGKTALVELLLRYKADINMTTEGGETALHLAYDNGKVEVVPLLIQNGASVDEIDQLNGWTVLHKACVNGKVEVARLLVQHEASVDRKDKYGWTPLDWARQYRHSDIVAMLEKGDFSIPLGHILTKFELQVLSGLLDAYSNEKIKEIQQSIRKKQGGDISREEVEKSLREGGLPAVADELEQSLLKGVEKAKHYEAYKAALEGAKTLTLRYLRFLLIGVPRSGKSTMRRRLLQEIINLRSLGQPSVSTGVAESYDVLVKKTTSESAAISGSQWWSLKKQSSDASQADSSDEGDLHYLTHLFYSLISKPNTGAAPAVDPTTSSETRSNVATDDSTIEENTATTEATANVADADRPKQQETTDTADESVPDKPALCKDSNHKYVDNAFEKLTNILQSDSPEDLHKLLHALTLINLMDIGGQPEFLDMLPAVTIGAALYLLFFRLDQDLHQHYPVTFLAPGESSEKTLETSYCIEEVIHQALASIASFSGQSSEDKAESASSRAILVGTYKDKVAAKDIAHKEGEVNEKFMKVEKYKDLLLTTKKGKPFFAVDNMEGTDESEMSEIRSNIEKIVKTCFAEVPIPASWLMFRIVLHLMNKPVITFAQCEEIARRLSMPTRVQEALWFFHHNIGSLLYYQDIPSVKDLVICTPQVIFDSVTTVIIDNFKHSNYGIPRKVVENFQQTGLFSLSDISAKTEHHRSTHLSPNQLVDVLKHSGILAEVKCDDEEATSSEPVEPKFIIPAVLKHASEKELKPLSSLEASPLMIRFEGGFVPFGVFSASIARLIARANSLSPKWSLHRNEIKKNKVKFLVAKAFVATLISLPQYLEIHVEKYPRASCEHSLAHICSTVRQTVVETLETTISKMKYKPQDSIAAEFLSSQQPFDLAFTCCLDYPEPHSNHLMKVGEYENGRCGECLLDGAATDLKGKHLLWFGQSEATASPKSSVSSTSSECNVEVTEAYLSRMEWIENGEEKVINIYDESAYMWRKIGQTLGLERGVLEGIEQDGQNVRDRLTKVLGKWYENARSLPRSDRYPKTWRGLIKLLNDSELGELADKVKKASLQQKQPNPVSQSKGGSEGTPGHELLVRECQTTTSLQGMEVPKHRQDEEHQCSIRRLARNLCCCCCTQNEG